MHLFSSNFKTKKLLLRSILVIEGEQISMNGKKMFTVFCSVAPVFTMYMIAGLPLVTVMAAVCVGYLFLLGKARKVKVIYELLIILFMVLCNSAFFVLFPSKTNGELSATAILNFVFSIGVVGLFLKSNYLPHLGYTVLRRVSIFSTIFIIFQQIVFILFRIPISGYIPFLATDYIDVRIKYASLGEFRPCSFFPEPAAYATFISFFLLIYFFQEKKDYRIIALMVIGLLCSQASTGIALLLIVVAMWLVFEKHIITYKNVGYIVVAAVGIMIGVFVAYKSGVLTKIIEHVVVSNNGRLELNAGALGRIGAIQPYFKKYMTSTTNWLFGNGLCDFYLYSNVDTYIPGFFKMLLSFGIVGITIYLVALISMVSKKNVLSKLLALLMMISSFFMNPLLGMQPYIYFPLILGLVADNETCRNL